METTTAIETLRTEAAASGDLAQSALCTVALQDRPLYEAEQTDLARAGWPSGIARRDATTICLSVIADAAAQAAGRVGAGGSLPMTSSTRLTIATAVASRLLDAGIEVYSIDLHPLSGEAPQVRVGLVDEDAIMHAGAALGLDADEATARVNVEPYRTEYGEGTRYEIAVAGVLLVGYLQTRQARPA